MDESVRKIQSDANGVVLELTTPELSFTSEYSDEEEYQRISIPGWGITGEFGKPELPVISKTIALPHLAGISYSFEILEKEEICGINIYPLQDGGTDHDRTAPVFVKDRAFYDKNTNYPEKRVFLSEPVIMRDLRLVNITCCPISYNPAEKKLEVIKKMRVAVDFTSGEVVNPKTHRRPFSSSTFAPLYRSVAMNFDDVNSDDVGQRGGYLFVVPNVNTENAIQLLADWKREKGFEVNIVKTSDIGTSKTNIYNYISNAYYNWEIPPDFVVLVGDEDGSIYIATDNYNCGFFDNAVTDHYYAKLEGSDYFPDVMVGRLSVQSPTELQTVVNKIIRYETNPSLATDWFTRSLMLADYSNISCKQTKQYGKMECLRNGYTQVDTVWFNWSMPTSTTANSINNGVGIVNFRGYLGWGGWDNGDVYALGNVAMNPAVFGCTCETGSFEITACLSEAWLRAGTASQPKGGIGCVGPSSWNTHTRWNNCIDSGMIWGMVHEGLEYYMEAVIRGKLELWNNFPFNHGSGGTNNSVECYYHVYNLIGDPGVSLWTAHPGQLVVDIPGDIPLGSNYYPVHVEDSAGDPVDSAYVNLWKGSEVFIGGYTDEAGYINIPIEPVTGGGMKVCVTKRNFLPSRQTVAITTGAAFVGINANLIDDDNTLPSSGNGDGVFNPGETVELDIQLKNFGSTTVSGITAEAACDNPYIAFSSSTITFGDLAPNDTIWSTSPFVFSIAPFCPHGEDIEIIITVSDNQSNEWISMLLNEVETADFSIRAQQLPGAGVNGKLDPGETSQLIITLVNIGTYANETLTGTISCESDEIEILDNQGTFDPISPGAYGDNTSDPFEAYTPFETYPGSPVTIVMALSGAGGYADTVEFVMELGVPNSDDPMARDSYGYYCYDDSDMGYPAAPIYNWMEISGLASPLYLPDYGNEQDCSIVVSFPPGFSFIYYGQTFDCVTICSNGWASLGANNMSNFRNWPIAAAINPPAMLAAYWDDLQLDSGAGPDGKVYAYYDEANHRVIIEWHNVHNREIWVLEDFQIILYDPIYHPTPTGDGIIDFQYHIINNASTEHYSTVGIARPENGDGIQYTYTNLYPPGAAVLHNNMVIRFTTQAGEGVESPVIGVSPASLTIEVPQGGSGMENLSILNTGFGALIYNITWSSQALLDQIGTATLTIPANSSDASGGPDTYGYSWIDSDETGGPAYNWIDISSIGTEVTFLHNDSTSDDMPIGFNFDFYGQTFDEYIISANGWISFTSHATAWNNTTLPNPIAPPNLLAVFFDDLDPLQPGAEVLVWDNGVDSLVVSFLNTSHYGSAVTGTYTFQAVLTADMGVTYQYQTLVGEYNNCTVGIQNSDGSDGLEVAYNEDYLHDGLAVRFNHPFLRIEPLSGTVSPLGQSDVSVYAYGYGLEIGSYPAELSISSNDPQTPVLEVPVTVNVTSGTPPPLQVTMTPQNPPIIIPASGGSFQFTGGINNISASAQQFDVWILITLPNGSTYGPTLLRQGLILAPGGSISRIMMQNVPMGAPPGEYYHYLTVGFYPDSVISSAGFNFTKSAAGDNSPSVGDWSLSGWDEDNSVSLPQEFVFYGCKPNPFNPVTEIAFDLPEAADVSMIIYDVLGREAAVIQDGVLQAGSYSMQWRADDMPSGVYFLNLQAGKYHTTVKLLLLK